MVKSTSHFYSVYMYMYTCTSVLVEFGSSSTAAVDGEKISAEITQ